jgi:hypothetical protein
MQENTRIRNVAIMRIVHHALQDHRVSSQKIVEKENVPAAPSLWWLTAISPVNRDVRSARASTKMMLSTAQLRDWARVVVQVLLLLGVFLLVFFRPHLLQRWEGSRF